MEVRFGKLDYSKEIFLKAETPDEVMRLRSVEKEPETVKWLERVVKTDDIIYDVGACVGAYSLVAGTLIGTGGKVYAIEPAFPSLTSLFMNISANKMEGKVIPLPLAFSDREIIDFVSLTSLHAGSASHGPDKGRHPQPMVMIPMDVFIERYGIPVPNLIKLDVDKSEVAVLKGAQKTLRNPRLREVLVEVDERHDAERQFIESTMFQAGFKIKEKHRLVSSMDEGIWNRLYVRREV